MNQNSLQRGEDMPADLADPSAAGFGLTQQQLAGILQTAYERLLYGRSFHVCIAISHTLAEFTGTPHTEIWLLRSTMQDVFVEFALHLDTGATISADCWMDRAQYSLPATWQEARLSCFRRWAETFGVVLTEPGNLR